MNNKRKHRGSSTDNPKSAPGRRESGMPGGGQGRRDEVGRSGVYAPGADNIPPDAEIRMAGSWGGGDYNESGGSELVYRDGQLLGGLTAGPNGEPTLDIHARGDRPLDAREDTASSGGEHDSDQPPAMDPVELRLRSLPKGSGGEPPSRGETRGEGTQDEERGQSLSS